MYNLLYVIFNIYVIGVISQTGGLGIFGSYGDTTKAKSKIQPGEWRRVTVSVNCAEGLNEKGELRTWIGTEAGVVLKEEQFAANDR